MPIFDQGYQHWKGELSGHAWRWWTITRQGVRIGMRSIWVRLLILMAWAPAVALAAVVIVWGLIEQKADIIMPLVRFLGLADKLPLDPRDLRLPVWTFAYYYFFQIEIMFVMLIVLIVGPGLISRDLRFNAIPLYFSRPLRRIDYFAGKLGVIGVIVALVAVVPALIAYVLGVAFSFDWRIIKDTYQLLLGCLGFGLIMTLSTGLLMLAFSALSRNSRYVMAMWLGFWLVTNGCSWTMQIIMEVQHQMEVQKVWMAQRRPDGRLPYPRPDIPRPLDWYRMLSYTRNLDALSQAVLNTNAAFDQVAASMAPHEREEMRVSLGGTRLPWYWSGGILAVLGLLSVWFLSFRVKSLDRLR